MENTQSDLRMNKMPLAFLAMRETLKNEFREYKNFDCYVRLVFHPGTEVEVIEVKIIWEKDNVSHAHHSYLDPGGFETIEPFLQFINMVKKEHTTKGMI